MTPDSNATSTIDRLIEAATTIYLSRQQTPQQQLTNAPAQQNADLHQTPVQNQVNARPVTYSFGGVSFDKRILVTAGVLVAGLVAWKAVKG